MSDTSTVWVRELGRGDWNLDGADLQSGNDLETAILISLFTDREANPDDVIPDGTGDPRGWVGDLGQPYKIGSRIWLLARAKQSPETLRLASDYIGEALQWLIDDGVVARFDITAEWSATSLLGAAVMAYQNNGSSIPMNFSWVWKAIH
ncbi:phage gp46-like protein [Oxalobacteraceae bacterium GrIS 1.11]